MRYVALLRGINVGGKNRVEMARLRETISRAGADDVRTYIASGNVLFADSRPRGQLVGVLERTIEEEFGLSLKVLVRDEHELVATADAIPDPWTNDQTMRTDVIFLWTTWTPRRSSVVFLPAMASTRSNTRQGRWYGGSTRRTSPGAARRGSWEPTSTRR